MCGIIITEREVIKIKGDNKMFTLITNTKTYTCDTLGMAFEVAFNLPCNTSWKLIDNANGEVITTDKD